MVRSKKQLDIRNLLDLHTQPEVLPLEPLLVSEGPLLPEPKQRQPYDELYRKQTYDRDLWSRN